MLKKFLSNCRGQVSLLFALMMPIFLLMIGVTLDLGWYYLNVSRLQNAADAAAVAGANALREDEYFQDYKNIKLIGKYPAKDSDKYRVDSIYELTAIENTNVIAEEYVAKNLSSDKETIINSWTKNEVQANEGLYTKDNNLYYVVKLKEDVRHFFLSAWFNDMTAPVTAVALLSKTAIKGDSENSEENPTMPTKPAVDSDSDNDTVVDEEQQKVIEKVLNENMIVGNWEVQDVYKGNNKDSDKTYYLTDEDGDIIADPETGEPTMITNFERRFGYSVYSKKWNHHQDLQNHYKTGEHRRTETIEVVPNKTGLYKVASRTKGAGNSYATSANGNNIYSEEEVDSLNIDTRQDVHFKEPPTKDWDLTLPNAYSVIEYLRYNDGFSKNSAAALMRIHTTINFNESHKERTTATDNPDILWVRIESEPMLSEPDRFDGIDDSEIEKSKRTKDADGNKIEGSGKMTELNSIRQFIINVNASNAGNDEESGKEYRPLIIFYDGPETNDVYESYKAKPDINEEPNNSDAVLHRESLPVIVNLNADFNGILYAPNSPVVLNDNGKNFTGFIVAKSYLHLKTEDEFYQDPSNGKYYASAADKTKEYFKISETNNGITNTMFIDEHGEVQYTEVDTSFKKCGEFSNFGRTDFTTHGYKVPTASSTNMLLSGR